MPHRLGFVKSRVSRLLIPVTCQLVARVIARRDARGPQSAARTCCLRTTSTGRRKGVFFGYFLCTSKESDPRYSIAEALAPIPTKQSRIKGARNKSAITHRSNCQIVYI